MEIEWEDILANDPNKCIFYRELENMDKDDFDRGYGKLLYFCEYPSHTVLVFLELEKSDLYFRKFSLLLVSKFLL